MARPDKLDPAVVRAKTEEHIANMQVKRAVHAVVRDTLQDLHGKKVTKRFATLVQKALDATFGGGTYHVQYHPEYSWTSLRIWGDNNGPLPWNSQYNVTLGYHSELTAGFDFGKWVDYHAKHFGYGAFDEHIEQAEKALRTVNVRVEAYNAAVQAVEAAWNNLEGLATWS